ncbi:MAG TPA: DUF4019 domain-containing protein [Dyella sp.]|uniref:DUF4019 domain-containing protein n=1 Tax=Dyella sp. TaxID=1869338 RepID=UPI002F9392CE
MGMFRFTRHVPVRAHRGLHRWTHAAFGIALVFATHELAAQEPPGLDSAMIVANAWLAQADTDQLEAMWQGSGTILQKNIGKGAWRKYILGLRRQYGEAKNRQWLEVERISNPGGLPPGEYLNVVYSTAYANTSMLETVSLVHGEGGWMPVGLIMRPLQQAPLAQAPGAR